MTALAAAALVAAAPAAAEPAYQLERSAVFEVRSDAEEAYRVMAAWPEGAPPATGWPVLYVLDGEDIFAIAALTARRLARAGARSGVSEGIVIGIAAGPLPRRVRDTTPATPGWTIPAGQPAAGLATGGAAAFLDLIARRIQPAVQARWRVDATRETLMGHSFGGLFALHAALTRPALFDRVVAVSPSVWFGDGLLTREAAGAPAGATALIAEGDRGEAAATLATRIKDARFLALPGQTHGSTMLAAMVPAVTFAFEKDGK